MAQESPNLLELKCPSVRLREDVEI
ncbi:uncharacterized protein G2W53_023189 [Senna tora]|uniref:Uncharacterized protein n=1 Tax=Senna tora TaxID=362788 RepID=A0A834T996_9FABA|nr:uncharacterized protein G2W53_023189 [Senna tora]